MILKNPLKEKFSQVPNEAIIDNQLSAGAFRVLMYLFSRPDNWKVRNNDIKKQLGIKQNQTLANYWKELETRGWIKRDRERKNGKFTGQTIFTVLWKIHNMEKPEYGKIHKHNNTDKNNNTDFNKSDKSVSLYSPFVHEFLKFYEERVGVQYNFTKIDGANIKKIVAYFKKISAGRELESWKIVLDSYPKWDKFYQGQLKPQQINSNLPNILNNIKNGKRNTKSRFEKNIDTAIKVAEQLNRDSNKGI